MPRSRITKEKRGAGVEVMEENKGISSSPFSSDYFSYDLFFWLIPYPFPPTSPFNDHLTNRHRLPLKMPGNILSRVKEYIQSRDLNGGKLLSKILWRGRSKTLRLSFALTMSSLPRGLSQAHLQKVFIGSTVAALSDVLDGFLETQVAAPVEIGHRHEG
jgi:hypothetical protein